MNIADRYLFDRSNRQFAHACAQPPSGFHARPPPASRSQRNFARRNAIERIAGEDEPDVPALRGWRSELFGADALRLKRGELALAVHKGEVSIIRLETPASGTTTAAHDAGQVT